MHEIIYLQSGTFANYIGQHFWNAQESYFDWEEDREDAPAKAPPEVNHDVSFREGLGRDGTPTYLPRVLIFDDKDAFGSLSKYNAMYAEVTGVDEPVDSRLWSGSNVLLRQPTHPKSQYLQDLDEEASQPPLHASPSKPPGPRKSYSPATWADYTRVYYHPRSLWPVPYHLSGTFDTWEEGVEAWNRFEQDDEFWETDFRSFAEECDLLQGLQVTSDASTSFASLTVSLLEKFQDEYAKHPILAFLPLSERKPRFSPFEVTDRRRLSCESRTISVLGALDATVVPLQHPSSWVPGQWSSGLNGVPGLKTPYHSSALLSAHLETATLPLRLNAGNISLNALTSLLNYHSDTPISHLSGALPLYDAEYSGRVFDFSSVVDPSVIDPLMFSSSTIYRGTLSVPDQDSMQDRLEQSMGIREPLLRPSFSKLQYPILTSFPPILSKESATIPFLSMLHTTSRTASLLQYYTDSLQTLVDEGLWNGLGDGWDREEIRDLGTDLRNLKEGYMRTDRLDSSDEGEEDDI